MEAIGFAAYLTKPARQSELFDILSTVLAGGIIERPTQPIVTRHTIREAHADKVRILLAEDNITNQQVAMGMLKKMGLRVDVVANGVEAIKALGVLPYDLILMDVQMPEMDGLEATRLIRSSQSNVRNHSIPIIAMTAHAMQGDRDVCLEAGMNDYVTKPVSPQALAEALAKWLPASDGEIEGHNEVDAAPVTTLSPKALVFDAVGMMSRIMDDKELAKIVVEGFLGDQPTQIQALQTYLSAGDIQSAERQAHAIKGAAAVIGGEAVREIALLIEKAMNAGDLDTAKRHFPILEEQFRLLSEELIKYLNTSA